MADKWILNKILLSAFCFRTSSVDGQWAALFRVTEDLERYIWCLDWEVVEYECSSKKLMTNEIQFAEEKVVLS